MAINPYKPGVWKYVHIEEFIRFNCKFFRRQVLPTLTNTICRVTIRNYLTKYIDVNDFKSVFIDWTKEVSKHYPSIRPCTIDTPMTGYNNKLNKPVIWTVYNWKQDNPCIEQLVKEMLKTANQRLILERIFPEKT